MSDLENKREKAFGMSSGTLFGGEGEISPFVSIFSQSKPLDTITVVPCICKLKGYRMGNTGTIHASTLMMLKANAPLTMPFRKHALNRAFSLRLRNTWRGG